MVEDIRSEMYLELGLSKLVWLLDKNCVVVSEFRNVLFVFLRLEWYAIWL